MWTKTKLKVVWRQFMFVFLYLLANKSDSLVNLKKNSNAVLELTESICQLFGPPPKKPKKSNQKLKRPQKDLQVGGVR